MKPGAALSGSRTSHLQLPHRSVLGLWFHCSLLLFNVQDQLALILNIEQLILCVGGADRDRTGDPLLAKQVLSQLSYSPIG